MKKKRFFIMAVVMAAVILLTAFAPTLAQDDGAATTAVRPIRDGLAIITPVAAPVGTPVTMTVFKRSDVTPAEGAGIWALTREQADALNQQVAALNESGEAPSADIDWESMVSIHGRLLGHTDDHGKLTHTFDETGRYVLLAVKRGYLPGRTSMAIVGIRRALAIRAPDRAPVGQSVMMTVYQRGTEEPISGAGVWALTREQAEAFKEQAAVLREQSDISMEDYDWESLASVYGIFLGRTGDNGELEYTFEESGGYLLLAVKRGYLPGRKGILIGELPKFLAMEVQRWAVVGDVVPMKVFERNSGDPVQGAGVWALTRDNAEQLRQEIASARELGNASIAEADWESRIGIHGFFLGRTDERGMLETVFSEAGGYVLVTWKPGYIPGFAFIAVRQPRPEVVEPEQMLFQRDGSSIQVEKYQENQ